MKNADRLLYFAYGSNMSSKRLRQRVPSAEPVNTATLSHHSLEFHKASKDGSAKCNAFETGNCEDCVIGVVFDIHHADKANLDHAEGLGFGYDIKQVVINSASGRSFKAFTYYATDINPSLLPYHWYRQHVLIGAREHGLPDDYIETISLIESVDDPDLERSIREILVHE